VVTDASALGFNAAKNENARKPAREHGGTGGCRFDSILKRHKRVYEIKWKARHDRLTKETADDRPQYTATDKLEKIGHNAAAAGCC
jgi:hypothetical protein